MKIVIEHKGVKRVISGDGFNICGSRNDLARIAAQISEKIKSDHYYGWVKVRDYIPDPHSKANTAPLCWEDNKTSQDQTP